MTAPDLVFGWRTALLSVAGAQMLVIAAALARTLRNRLSNRCLATLLVVLAGLLTPYAIGFAGFYDRYPWLSFAPFAIPLAVGPLLYFHAHALALGRLPARPLLHLAPALLQFAYQAVSFCLPLALKLRWDGIASPLVDPVVTAGIVVGLAGYCVASLRLLARYRIALAQQRSDDDLYAALWLSRTVAAMIALLAAWIAYTAWDRLVAPLDYFGELGLYLIIALVGCYLAVEGWRHAQLSFVPALIAAATASPPPVERDWRALGEQWAAQVRSTRAFVDPELSLGSLARLLGTNSTHLSRAINEGLGMNFSTFIATLRCEEVAAALRAGSRNDLLGLALDSGFGSKASFNRAFQTVFGLSPSAYRVRHGSDQQ